jgi:hypothetical protein
MAGMRLISLSKFYFCCPKWLLGESDRILGQKGAYLSMKVEANVNQCIKKKIISNAQGGFLN